jgi:hypothetical protein
LLPTASVAEVKIQARGWPSIWRWKIGAMSSGVRFSDMACE